MYRTIDASFWTDSKVRRLDASGRLLFLYLITNPHTHVSGLYYLPTLIAQHETGLSAKQLRARMDTLSSLGFCRFDPTNELVWVVRMFRFQGSGLKNTLSAAHHISKDIHNSFLINEFLEAYPEVSEHVKNRVSIPYPVGATPIPDSPFPIPEHRTQNTENGERIPAEIPHAEKRVGRTDPAADCFAASYAEHIGNPYGWKQGDFPQLVKLRKRLSLPSDATPNGWEPALENYFASPFAEFSLQHFAAKFDTFMNSALDRFKTPVSHAGVNGHVRTESPEEAKQRRTREASERILARLDKQTRGGLPGGTQ